MPVDHDAEEIAELRRRAYASEADISSDPAALDRLIELESRAASVRTVTDAAPARPDETAGDALGAVGSAKTASDERVLPGARRGLIAALGLVAAVAVGVAVVSVSSAQGSSVPTGATRLANLQLDPRSRR